MAKFDFKQLLLQKGEKIALGACAAGGGLLAILGITNMISAESPSEQSGKLKNGAKSVLSAMRSQDGSAAIGRSTAQSTRPMRL